jgi:saccharopine dehydrogenase-like NADP-dependent oxidoreductase
MSILLESVKWFCYLVNSKFCLKTAHMKKVLILGAGLVAKPIVEYLLANNFSIIIASPMKHRADEMINGNPLGSSLDWSMDDPATLERLVSENDITVSLLPYKYHPDVAKACLKNRRPLVTTSYVQQAMQELNDEAKKTGIILLNEMGLDPGLDHMTAMRVIDRIHGKGGKVEELYSLCGALPAPEAADNPLGYKFSWSPKGVILASRNGALFLKKGRRISIKPIDLFRETFIYDFPGIGDMEVYPNRDSISYKDIYNIPEASTIYRGTLRYRGWCETLDAMKRLSMLDDTPNDYSGMSYADFLAERAGDGKRNIMRKISLKLGVSEKSKVIQAFEWLGFFSEEKMNYGETTSFEITSDRMIGRMDMADNERDMVAMQHVLLASFPDGKREVRKSYLLDFGTPATNTAIARTVALPAAIAVKLILSGAIRTKGVLRPVLPEIYNPVLDELKSLEIEIKEESDLPESDIVF